MHSVHGRETMSLIPAIVHPMYKSNIRNSEPVAEQLIQGGYRNGTSGDCLRQHPHPCRSNNSSCLPLPLFNSLDEHTVGLGNESLDAGKLNWKERIRHYTWTFFAMTMATGGIANVLYAGKRCIYTTAYLQLHCITIDSSPQYLIVSPDLTRLGSHFSSSIYYFSF